MNIAAVVIARVRSPFSLMTFDDVRHHASQIEVVVRRRLMPPWKPEAGFAEFANVHRLTNHEIKVLSAWIASDRAEGNPEDLPLTPIFPCRLATREAGS